MTDHLLTAEQVAERLGMTPAWVLAEARARRMPHYRFGRRVRFDLGQVSRYLAEHRVREVDPPVIGRRGAREASHSAGSRGRVPAVPLSDDLPRAMGPDGGA